jgi:hypothetical protein
MFRGISNNISKRAKNLALLNKKEGNINAFLIEFIKNNYPDLPAGISYQADLNIRNFSLLIKTNSKSFSNELNFKKRDIISFLDKNNVKIYELIIR